MAKRPEHEPGEQAEKTGTYRELSVLGAPTGRTVYVSEGDRLPVGPRGFTWRPVDE